MRAVVTRCSSSGNGLAAMTHVEPQTPFPRSHGSSLGTPVGRISASPSAVRTLSQDPDVKPKSTPQQAAFRWIIRTPESPAVARTGHRRLWSG